MADTEKTIIGWTEYIDLPEWNVFGLRVKVDTGARTSALHVEDFTILERKSVQTARFDVILHRLHDHRRVTVQTPVVRWGRVRSSMGHYAVRCFVKTPMRIGNVVKIIEVSLVSREKMIYRMLLGREALQPEFIVDVSSRAVLGKRLRRTKRKPS